MAEKSQDTSSVHTHVCETSSELVFLFSPDESVKVRKSVSADNISVHTVQFEKVTGLLQFRAPLHMITFKKFSIKY